MAEEGGGIEKESGHKEKEKVMKDEANSMPLDLQLLHL